MSGEALVCGWWSEAGAVMASDGCDDRRHIKHRTGYVAARRPWCCFQQAVAQVRLSCTGHKAVSKGNQGLLGAIAHVGLMLVVALARGRRFVRQRGTQAVSCQILRRLRQ
jgi:hypothetical protein